ncbi:response regulator transcription factor [Lapillicoccus sp.]|uniref:response regulator transcription factor n=1 Tax=Lapillicoccus sp. TaxID=1909287 RepID=UPI00260129DD|nr:response regulator transcription factor [Lapillicoccus sp.]
MRDRPGDLATVTLEAAGDVQPAATRAGDHLLDSRLIAAVRAAATGASLIEPSITQRLLERFAEPVVIPGIPARLALLTDRELDVLRLIPRGLSNAEIAAELVVAEATVKTHVGRILTKLGVRDRVQAVVVAYETGFVGRSVG